MALADVFSTGDGKACCAALYEHPGVRWILGGELHPGGEALTLRAARLAGIARGQRLLDVASGDGATARLLVRELGVEAVGVDYGASAVAAAGAAARAEALSQQVSFVQGDAEALPFEDASFDAAICECSLCTFPDKAAAAREIARVLRPGGAAVIADVTADPERLHPLLRSAAARMACVADALPLEGYERLLSEAGLAPVASERADGALATMVDRVEARLKVARMARLPELEELRAELDVGLEALGLARAAIAAGELGYAVIVGRR
jgi:arsenite methyltransferase